MGASGSAETHSAKPAGAPGVGQISTVGKPPRRSASASHSALAATSAACTGSAEIDGMRSQASRSACRSSRWARTKSRSGLLTDGNANAAAAGVDTAVRRWAHGPPGPPARGDAMTTFDSFTVDAADQQAPWATLAGGDRTGGLVTFGQARLGPRSAGPSRHVHTYEDEAVFVFSGVLTV